MILQPQQKLFMSSNYFRSAVNCHAFPHFSGNYLHLSPCYHDNNTEVADDNDTNAV